ncbi:MAG: hypothetical protein GXP27_14190 [Planctomycetes bacterium]|nr:hypothetical protein [Planctomycetota bacterium]
MSLRERLRRHGVPEAPELPAGVEPAEIRKDGHTITIHLGRNDSAPLLTALFLFMAMLAATVGTAFFLFALHDAPSPINWVFGIFIALPVVVLIAVALAPVLRRRWVRTFVEISPDLFQVVWETPLLRRRQTIPMDELEELGAHGADQGVGLFRFLGGGHLIAVSDRKMITFAKDFQPERLRYLRDLICHTVATM